MGEAVAATVGRPVLMLGAVAGSPGAVALGERWHVSPLQSADETSIAEWIETHSEDRPSVVALGPTAALAALRAVATAGAAVSALVLVSPGALPAEGPLRAACRTLPTPTLVMMGDRSANAANAGLSAWREALVNGWTVLVFDSGDSIATDRPFALVSAAGDFLDRQARFSFETRSLAIGV